MCDVSRETMDRLEVYKELIIRWNPRINLVAPASIADLDSRHIQDCLQIAQHADPKPGTWVDMGSGGGLPGIVMAVAFSQRPVAFTLLESDQRKCAFLRTVIRTLGLTNTKVENRRIEDVNPLDAAYISARALAPLPRLMAYLHRHLAETGQAWIMKGENWQTELEAAQREWNFKVLPIPSVSKQGSAILRISGVTNA